MKEQEFIENFVAQYDDLIDASKITLNKGFRDIEGWSSFVALSLIAMVDEVYNVKVTGDDIRKSKTIGDLFSIVNSKK